MARASAKVEYMTMTLVTCDLIGL